MATPQRYRVVKPFGPYKVGDMITPSGHQRAALFADGLIESATSVPLDEPIVIAAEPDPEPEMDDTEDDPKPRRARSKKD